MMMGRWYIVRIDRMDKDDDTGADNLREAMRKCREINDCTEGEGFGRDAYIIEVAPDGAHVGEWNEDGEYTPY
jgi:hypothetical protein